MKKATKRVLFLVLAAVMVFAAVGCGGGASGSNAAEEYYDKVCSAQTLLDELADEIYSNWYDAIYNDEFGDDINVAIATAFSDLSSEVDEIEALDAEIAQLFKEAKEGECGAEVKAVMGAYSDYYEFVINVSGSFNSYSADKETLKKTLASALKNLSYEI